ncbi:MAG: TldD/PmbA family protein [Candidatus Odinarchaeota archaeon]|nr:TldD/PmbA family protein [Candidatus Odinarchaeota archaeon]
MIDLSRIVEYLNKLNVDFGDVRFENRLFLEIRVVNGNIRSISKSFQSGISIRALVKGAWGYSSTTNLSWENIKSKAEEAYRLAKVASEKQKRTTKIELDIKPIVKRLKPNIKKNPADVSMEDKLSLLFDLDDIQRKFDSRIVNSNTVYRESVVENKFANTIGSDIEWTEVRVSLMIASFAREEGKLQYSYDTESGTKGYELIESIDLSEFGSKVPKEAIDLLSADKPPSGVLTVIADPSIAGLLAHEVMGHASEADEVVKRRSFLTDMVGKQVASELITMVDDGTIEGAYGSIPFDSEGTPSERTVIIENGIYKGYMHSLETAAILGAKPTGNGRAQDFNRRVWVRMRNTFFEAGDWSLDEVIEDTKSGLLALKAVSGMEDPTGGGFEARALMGYIIENGEKKNLVRALTLTGKALEILKTVDAVSKDFKLDGGFCGKGEEDWVPVTTGGAYIRARIIVGGG